MPTPTPPPPEFLYFDLGNVLLFFDHRRACRQMAQLSGADAQLIWEVVFESGLELEYEAGAVSSQQFYETFCRGTNTRPDYRRLAHAASDIFEVNAPAVAILGQLAAAGQRLGLLSNTNEMHWQFVVGRRYGLIPAVFEQIVLSYEVKSFKPDPHIFLAAAEQSGARPERIFYVDDIAGHVAAARAVGLDAVQYTDGPSLARELRRRGVPFNY
jgi:putative hydrolase of the HAD superfamily